MKWPEFIFQLLQSLQLKKVENSMHFSYSDAAITNGSEDSGGFFFFFFFFYNNLSITPFY